VRQFFRPRGHLGEPVEALIELPHECLRLGASRVGWCGRRPRRRPWSRMCRRALCCRGHARGRPGHS